MYASVAYELLFWNVLLSSSAGLRWQPAQAAKILSEAWGTTHQRREVSMAECPKSTLYKGWTSKRPAHIKSHLVFYIPQCPGSFYLPLAALSQSSSHFWKENSLLFFPPPEAPLPSHPSKKETPHNQETTFGVHPGLHTSGWGFLGQEKVARPLCLGKCSLAAPSQRSTPSAFPKVSVRKFFFFLFFFFLVLISSNKNNEFLKPTRMWQGVNKADQEGDVWPVSCSSHKSYQKPELQRTSLASGVQRASSLHPPTGTPTPHLSQRPRWSTPVTPTPTNWPTQGLSSFPSVANTADTWGSLYNLMCFRDMGWYGFVEGCLESSTWTPNFKGL